MNILIVLFWAALGSVISLIGGLILLRAKKFRSKVMNLALPFGAGALLAAAFFDLLPEALQGQNIHLILYAVLAGFLGFFLLERSATWFHQHHEHAANRDKTHGKLIITGNILHNAIDGVALGAAFLVDIPTGVITTLAIASHEIPKEIAEFGLLLAKGYSARKTLAMNIAAALATITTTVGTFIIGKTEPIPLAPLLGVTAGFFIYIAASDIIPDIHEQPKRLANIQSMMLLLGIAIVAAAILVAEHSI